MDVGLGNLCASLYLLWLIEEGFKAVPAGLGPPRKSGSLQK